MSDAHIVDIIEDKLSVSYEPSDTWVSDDDREIEHIPAHAVLLVTGCCALDHDHVTLNHSEAAALAEWLDAFVRGDYDE